MGITGSYFTVWHFLILESSAMFARPISTSKKPAVATKTKSQVGILGSPGCNWFKLYITTVLSYLQFIKVIQSNSIFFFRFSTKVLVHLLSWAWDGMIFIPSETVFVGGRVYRFHIVRTNSEVHGWLKMWTYGHSSTYPLIKMSFIPSKLFICAKICF